MAILGWRGFPFIRGWQSDSLRPIVRYSRQESEFDRAIGFLDATFALALTLLVTTLDVRDSSSAWTSLGSLNDAVGAQFIAFGIAFAVIANYWLVHHRMVADFKAIDPPMIVANLFLIAAIVVIPFTTEAVGDPAIVDLPLPTVAFAVNVAVASVLSTGVYWLAWKRDLLRSPPTRAGLRGNLAGGLVPAAVFLASIPIAYLASPAAAKLSWISLLILKPLTSPPSRRKRKAG
jgi:TMEM175 potassium channel family protein